MEDKSRKKKEWIKNFAIIFLAVLLVLTFCSNTIMNYSLPEVAAQYCMSGSITNKVSGNGYVEAQDPYKVVFKQTRKVDSVAVRTGDEVKKGDVLYVLEKGESEELKEARKAVDAAKEEYEKYIIANRVSSAITDAVQDGSAGDLSNNQAAITSSEKRKDNLKAAYDKAQDELDKYTNGNAKTYEEYKKRDEIQEALSQWERQLSNTESDWSAVTYEEKTLLETAEADIVSTAESYNASTPVYNNAKSKYDSAKSVYDSNPESESALADYEAAKAEYDAAEGTYTSAKAAYEAAVAALDKDPVKKIKLKRDSYNTAKGKVTEYTNLLAEANKVINEKKEDLTNKVTLAKDEYEKADKNYNELITNMDTKYAAAAYVKKIEEAEAKVKELEEGDEGSLEITAPVAGTIVSMAFVAGETIQTGSEVATIQIAGKGFTMSLTVPNEQAVLVSVGDEAEVSNGWWYTDVHARVSSIKPDPTNPSKQKVIKFEVEGDVSSGQSLSVTVGQKTANYDIIVPSSAVREDTNGKFVLRVNAKSTPLGNRYIAERVEVKVLAEDATRTAISGDLSGWEYIITTATRPIEDGQQVRLKD